jgi:Iap family predicted aminopeptidase
MEKRYKFRAKLIKFFTEERVAALLDISRDPGENGEIQLQAGGDFEKGKTIAFPRVTLSVEHFGRISRLLERKVPVQVEMNVETRFYDDDPMGYNTIAEIPGVDPKLKDQVVMLGGHMDSWHASEGATDNGAGVIAAMEAVRLLEKLGVQPRRTIRVALWSGEEQGLYGSAGYARPPPIRNTRTCRRG